MIPAVPRLSHQGSHDQKLPTRKLRTSLLVLCAMCLVPVVSAVNSSSPVVQIPSGKVRGLNNGQLMIFKGVPYAAPPVGNLRWRPPQPVASWNGIRGATEYGHDCMQTLVPNDDAPLRTKASEDCLYLNVWAPRDHGNSLLPVMVWIYGGGFVIGASSPAVYDGSTFAEKGVVFVSFNYRLNRFGFFAFPALLNEPGPYGCYEIMDQIAALKWVRRNIAAFGGNPHEVTIFGQSAGGISVSMLLSSPEAKGLFARAIIESGGGRSGGLGETPLEHPGPTGGPSAVQIGINFARSVDIDGTGAAALLALRRLPPEKVVAGLAVAGPRAQRVVRTYSGPIVDGVVLPHPVELTYKECLQVKVPVIVGATSGDLGFSDAHTLAEIFAPFGKNAAQAEKAFDVKPSEPVAQVAQKVAAAETMIEPARFVAQRISACGESAYEYRFSYVADPMRSSFHGAPHASEVPYVFGTLRESGFTNFGKGLTSEAYRLSSQINEYWVNFAKTGDPNGPGLPHWGVLTTKRDELMNFTKSGPKGEVDPSGARLHLVETIQK
jgi:para-nitrobenzyl esterase